MGAQTPDHLRWSDDRHRLYVTVTGVVDMTKTPVARLPPTATRSQRSDWTCGRRARRLRMHTGRTRRGRGQQTRRYPWRGGAAEQTFRATGACRLQPRQAECFFNKKDFSRK
jgi:hypothetical protein